MQHDLVEGEGEERLKNLAEMMGGGNSAESAEMFEALKAARDGRYRDLSDSISRKQAMYNERTRNPYRILWFWSIGGAFLGLIFIGNFFGLIFGLIISIFIGILFINNKK